MQMSGKSAVRRKFHLGIGAGVWNGNKRPLPVGGVRQGRECHSKEILPPGILIGFLVLGLEGFCLFTE